MKHAVLVCGAGGFIGSHLVKQLKRESFWVRGVDLHRPQFAESFADEFIIGDLKHKSFCEQIIDGPFDKIYQFAADMGGAGYVFSGENDADIMLNSASINLNVLQACQKHNIKNVFFSSSACVYPVHNQVNKVRPNCEESSAYPAAPDSEYGWEKLFAERLYLAFNKNKGMNNKVARYHNIFGPYGVWQGGREKAPAAICRKVAMAQTGGKIEIWGDGNQTRSFLYIDECVQGTLKLNRSDFAGPLNIGSDQMVTINQLVDMVCEIAGKQLYKTHIAGPVGVLGRNSDNRLIQKTLGWQPTADLYAGLEKTYAWVEQEVDRHMLSQVG